ncbi:MAG: radical SAM protein [Ruminococcus sp.]
MIDRACISINNRCNLNCSYCHFHTTKKAEYLAEAEMNVFSILDNIKQHIDKYDIKIFKLGFVGNGEPLLDYEALNEYIEYISDYLLSGKIAAYTITNGTLVDEGMLGFFKKHNVNVGFSIDGISEIHNRLRCNTHSEVMKAIELYRSMNGSYPSMNCTVGRDTLEKAEDTIAFFEQFGSRITFSRMIGKDGISLDEFHSFLNNAKSRVNVRIGKYDCTMYGGMCGAGINNIFYANGNAYICGNCVDLPPIAKADTPIDCIKSDIPDFDRNTCFKESQGL